MSHFATRFDVVDAPQQFNRVLLIIDFPGGAWTPPHAPGGSLYATVIEGEVSSTVAGAPGETHAAGTTFTANPGEYVELGNAAAGNARVIATILLPKGAPLTIDQAGFSSDAYSGPADNYRVRDSVSRAPRPATVFHSSIPVERPAGAFELVHVVLDFEPGTWTPQHMHGGEELVMMTIGELSLQRQGEVKVLPAGASWVNTSGLIHAAGNDTGAFAQAGGHVPVARRKAAYDGRVVGAERAGVGGVALLPAAHSRSGCACAGRALRRRFAGLLQQLQPPEHRRRRARLEQRDVGTQEQQCVAHASGNRRGGLLTVDRFAGSPATRARRRRLCPRDGA